MKFYKRLTVRSNEHLQKYFNDVVKFNVLTPQEERELFIKIKNGCQESFNKIINSNLRFVISVAKQFDDDNSELIDLINDGNIGLIEAAKRYDLSFNCRFLSYAIWWIKQSILIGKLEKYSYVKTPTNQITVALKVKKIKSEFEQKLLRDVEDFEVFDLLTEQELRYYNNYIESKIQYLSSPIQSSDEDLTIEDIIYDEHNNNQINNNDTYNYLKYLISKLNKNEKYVIEHLYGFSNSLVKYNVSRIAKELNMSPTQVNKIKERALKKIKNECKQLNF